MFLVIKHEHIWCDNLFNNDKFSWKSINSNTSNIARCNLLSNLKYIVSQTLLHCPKYLNLSLYIYYYWEEKAKDTIDEETMMLFATFIVLSRLKDAFSRYEWRHLHLSPPYHHSVQEQIKEDAWINIKKYLLRTISIYLIYKPSVKLVLHELFIYMRTLS